MSAINFSVRTLLFYFPVTQFLLAILFLYSNSIKGQENIRFNHLTSDQGLCTNEVRCLTKDKEGFLWIGTLAGLNRFDGSNVFSFTHTFGDSTSLLHNRVNTLFADENNRLWVGTDAGLSILSPGSNHFINFDKIQTADTLLRLRRGLRSIGQFKNQIWVATANLLLRSSKDSLNFEVIQIPIESQKQKVIYYLPQGLITSANGLWILTSSGPLYTTDGKSFYSKQNNPEHWAVFDRSYISALIDEGDSLFYFTNFDFPGVYIYNAELQTLDSIRLPSRPSPYYSILSICKTNKNEIWGTTDLEGTFRIDLSTQKAIFYIPDIKNPYAISSKGIQHVICDDQGNIYLGADGGLNWVNPVQSPFNFINTAVFDLGGEEINAVAEDDNGLFWLSTLGSGLFTLDVARNEIKPFPLEGRYNTIATLNYENNYLYLNTPWGLARINTQTRKFEDLHQVLTPQLKKIFTSPPAFSFRDKSGHDWMGLFLSGLIHYNYRNGEYDLFTSFDSTNKLATNIITTGVTDDSDTIWIGYAEDAISCVNTTTHKIENFKFPPLAGAEKTGGVQNMALDGVGHLWISTKQGGLLKFDIKNKTFTPYDTRDHLSSNNLGGIQVDQQNKIWINASNGLNCFDPESETFTLYNKSDGLSFSQFNRSPMFKGKDGKIFIWSDNSVIWFDPSKFNLNPYLPKLVFSVYKKSGESFTIPHQAQQLDFTYKDKMITFDFFGINFIDATKTQYAYYLENLEEDWNYSGNQPNATYSSLPPGDYILHIKATNKANNWDVPETLMNIHVSGPFWRKWWFITLCCCLGLTLVYGVNHYRFAQFKKILNMRNKISKDLHDDIGSTLSSISISSTAVEYMKADQFAEVQSTVSLIGQSARTAMENMSDIVWAINPTNDTFKNMMDRLQIFAIKILEAKDIQLQFDVPETLQSIKLTMPQRKNIYLILREAIHNVAKYSGATICMVSAKLVNKKIDLEVMDDGTGFENIAPSLGGNGMINMRERADELKASFQINSEVQKGTRVSLQFDYS